MEINIPYKVVKSHEQYYEYCDILISILEIEEKTEAHEDAIELLTLLTETYSREQFPDREVMDPVQSLKWLMKEHKMKAVDLAIELDVSKSLVSDIIHYRRGFSKDLIRKLSGRFAIRQEAFNRPYDLQSSTKSTVKK